MVKKKEEVIKEEEVVVEVKLPETAKAEVLKVVVPVSNELTFLTGEEIKLKDLPFKVVGIRGLELILKRVDLV